MTRANKSTLESGNLKPYGSARDLPNYRESKRQLKALKCISLFPVLKVSRKELKDLEVELERVFSVVDSFYQMFGPQKWVFHDSMSLSTIEKIVKGPPDIEPAEERLIETYRDDKTMSRYILKLHSHKGFRSRRQHIERALQYYKTNHFDSCVLHLLPVIDGFVNDLYNPNGKRRGLHAREKEEMVAWNSVTAHHQGIYSVMDDFQKTFKKRVDEEVFRLHRHGIVHGTVVRFDNIDVATRAWNLLFSLGDWATANIKSSEIKPTPSWADLKADFRTHSKYKRHERAFSPRSLIASDTCFTEEDVYKRASLFLDSWQNGRWGIVAEFMPPLRAESHQKRWTIDQAKLTYKEYGISQWSIDCIEYPRLSAADVKGVIRLGDEKKRFKIRMVLSNSDGHSAIPGEGDADWYVGIWAPSQYFQTED